jgi:hypothetical protein
LRNLRVFFGNPPIPIIKLWKNALSQSTEGIFLLYLITSIVVESVRNNSLTYSWIEVFLMVITASTIRRYYKRHRYIYLMVFDNMAQRLERYMAMPYMEDETKKEIRQCAIQARNGGHLLGYTAYLASQKYTRLEQMSQKIIETAGKKSGYWDTFVLVCIISYAIVTIGTMVKDFLL